MMVVYDLTTYLEGYSTMIGVLSTIVSILSQTGNVIRAL